MSLSLSLCKQRRRFKQIQTPHTGPAADAPGRVAEAIGMWAFSARKFLRFRWIVLTSYYELQVEAHMPAVCQPLQGEKPQKSVGIAKVHAGLNDQNKIKRNLKESKEIRKVLKERKSFI